MELEILGIGNAFTAIHYNTSFLLHGRKKLLIDGPNSLLKCLKQRGLGPQDIHGIILTHIHGDHTAGLETLLLWKKWVQGVRTDIFTTRRVFEELRTKVYPSFAETFDTDMQRFVTLSFEEYAVLRELSETGETELMEGVGVEVRYNWHPGSTLGLKIKTADSSVGISGDTLYDPGLLKGLRDNGTISESRYQRLAGSWLWDCDVIFHEADRVAGGPHTHEATLLALPEEIRRKIRLVHVPDDYQADSIPIASEGAKVRLGS